ncbi:ankyrin repeat-containing domain protein [Annulohypoxylon bovei var. microspora]|nr:ankyrin repeat-containing domain protein [Annulohypoxylon bovei var. microspora]
MATLMTLPTEVLHEIAKAHGGTRRLIPRILKRRDLVNLSYVNRRLHLVITRVLYEYNRDFEDFYALMYAVRNNNLPTLEVIFSLKLNLYYHDTSNKPGYLLGQACAINQPRVFQWLLEHGAVFENSVMSEPIGLMAFSSSSVLHYAMTNKRENMALLLLSRGATPFFIEDHENFNSDQRTFTTALHYATKYKMPEVAEHLVRKMSFSVDLKNSKGITPLFEYFECMRPGSEFLDLGSLSDCPGADTNMLQWLILLGANIDFEKDGKLPLTLALLSRNYAHVDVLLDAGARIQPSRPQPGVPYPIHAWVRSIRPPHTPGMIHQNPKSHLTLKRLVEAGADLDGRYEQGYTPLEETLLMGKPEAVSSLLELGASMGPETTKGEDILDFFMLHAINADFYAYQRALSLIRGGARIDTQLASMGKSFLEALLDHSPRRSFEYYQFLGNLVAVAASSMSALEHVHKVFGDYVNSGTIFDHKKVEICNILIHNGALLRDAQVASKVASECIGLARSSTLFNRGAGYVFVNSLLGMTSERELYHLLTQALSERVELYAHMVLDHIGTKSPYKTEDEWLHLAAQWGNCTIIHRLMKGKLDVNAPSKKSGRTPLAEAMGYRGLNNGHYNSLAAYALLDYGANPFLFKTEPICTREDTREFWDRPGISAFEYAIHRGSLELIKRMWNNASPETRPNLKAFTSCTSG